MASAVVLFFFFLFVARGTSSSSPSITAPAFLWSNQRDGIKDSRVDYRTISQNDLPKLILSQGGWSSLLCPGENLHNPLDIGLVFIATQLQSSNNPALSHLLEVSFTRSNFSMAFPYVSPSEEDKTMETSLISGFTQNCGHHFPVDNIAFLDSCSVDAANFPKLADMQAVRGYLTSVLKNKHNRQKHLIVLCNGGSASSERPDPSWSEGDIFSELISSVEQSGASYSVLYASDPYKSPEYTSYRALDRFLAEGSAGNGSVGSSFCDGVCQIKSSFLEGLLVAIVLLIILISGLCCMMGIDTPTRFEASQDS